MLHNITHIPNIMRNRGWINAAKLMERWFSLPATAAPNYAMPDTETIKMDSWVLTFHRAQQVYDSIISERIWANKPAQILLAKMLREKGLISEKNMSFGDLGSPVVQQDQDHINHRIVDGVSILNLNDLGAALGSFDMRVVVAGTVSPIKPESSSTKTNQQVQIKIKHQIAITEVGVYLKDTYDFNGFQFLGWWNEPVFVSALPKDPMNPLLPGSNIYNSDFRDWREETGKGGDYLIFSDMKRIVLPKPDVILLDY